MIDDKSNEVDVSEIMNDAKLNEIVDSVIMIDDKSNEVMNDDKSYETSCARMGCHTNVNKNVATRPTNHKQTQRAYKKETTTIIYTKHKDRNYGKSVCKKFINAYRDCLTLEVSHFFTIIIFF